MIPGMTAEALAVRIVFGVALFALGMWAGLVLHEGWLTRRSRRPGGPAATIFGEPMPEARPIGDRTYFIVPEKVWAAVLGIAFRAQGGLFHAGK